MRIVLLSIPSFADCDFPLIKALRESGHEVFYIVRVAPYLMKSTLLDFDAIEPVSGIFPASLYPAFEPWKEWLDLDKCFVSNDAVGKTGPASWRLYKAEKKLIASLRPDVLHYENIPFIFHFLHLLRYRKKSLCVIHDPLPHSGEVSLRDSLKRRILPWVCRKFVLLNRLQTEDFCRRWRVRRDRVFFAELGPYTCYTRFGTQPFLTGRYFLFFGRLSPYKGVDYALEAFDRIHRQFPDIRFVIAGAGPVCFDAGKYADRGFVEFIHRYLTVEEIAGAVSSALFVICPYTDATQSGVAQTAFALSAPVLSTSVGNFPQVVEEGKTGLLVPPKDVDALSAALSRLLSDEALLRSMRENIEENNRHGAHSWTAIAEKYLEIYGK